MMSHIVNGLVAIPASQHLILAQSRTKGHDLRFLQPCTRVQAYKFSFPVCNQDLELTAIRRHKQAYSKRL